MLLLLSLAQAADSRWYLDADGDGYGHSLRYTIAATQPTGYVATNDDCQDGDPSIHPGLSDACDGVDNDCDGNVDSSTACGHTVKQWRDHGYWLVKQDKDWSSAKAACEAKGYTLVTISSEEEDTWLDTTIDAVSTGKWWTGFNDITFEGQWAWIDESARPYSNWYAGEPNNGMGGGEEDCVPLNRFHPDRGWNDEDCANAFSYVCESGKPILLYEDADGDGYGNPKGYTETSSDILEGYADNPDDCDDDDATVNPAAAERWYDDVDGDCDGHSDFDADFDGVERTGGDCDDANSLVHPGAEDAWYDGLDADCAGDSDFDADKDGTIVGVDCDDEDPTRHPEAADDTVDGVDQDCDGLDGPPPQDSDSAPVEDSPPADGDDSGETDAEAGGCGCSAGGAGGGALALLLGLSLVRRRSSLLL